MLLRHTLTLSRRLSSPVVTISSGCIIPKHIQIRTVAFVHSSGRSPSVSTNPSTNPSSLQEEASQDILTSKSHEPSEVSSTYKVRGIRKDESSYMTSPTGDLYPGNDQTLAPARIFLGEKYALPVELLRQSITHKSFAHGKTPYNEKLAIIGQQLLRLEAGRAVATAAVKSPLLINGLNFDVNQRAVEILTSTTVLSRIAENAKLDTSLFWRPTGESRNGLNSVRAKAIQALVGAVLLHHGQASGRKFVEEVLLSGPVSVFEIADKNFQD